jgi:hypothetical protein
MIKVTINKEIKENKCRCGDMFAHWKKFGHQDIRSCPIKGCSGTDLKGTFVNKVDSEDSKTYIIPLCSEHAKKTEAFDVMDSIRFVSSDFNRTCGTAPGKSEEANIL